ncbi:hypothetical protein HMP0015_1636 [Acinetobacter haemolyticus ATCC 19194]|uniref:Uncharacterized protein n=1 Tax=Acinetobacter haemolyticus ATCC 19194 TaxID=707232 RepID=D4XPJ4_ACIHA|nr:hypothetical protein HMP0015_1636 [Acinetobacter haemolyticus ATCC 19194]
MGGFFFLLDDIINLLTILILISSLQSSFINCQVARLRVVSNYEI